MKKLLFVAAAFVAFSMLASTVVVAEPTHPNEVGLYMTPDGYGATGTSVIGVPVTVYLVLTKPTDLQNGGTPLNNIYGFECQLNFNPNPFGNLFKLLDNLPSVSINVGDSSDINQGFLEYVVGIGTPLAVVDEAAVLITFTFMAVAPNPFVVTLGPPGGYSSIPGQMAFYTNSQYSDDAQVMYSVGGSHESPVFIFNGEAVAVEDKSFGSVKALYR
jgi:hypothetical protein